MPELPEVETVRAGLSRLIIGKNIISVDFDTPKSFPNTQTDIDAFLLNTHFIAVRRRGKVLMLDLSSGYSLMIHLKMTGQLVYRGEESFGAGHPNDSLIGELPDKSTRVTLKFAQGGVLFFNDQRKFGWARLLPTAIISKEPFMMKLGPEPLEDSFTYDRFISQLKRRQNTTIKAALLDQTVLAGIGNIYADESLFAAKIHPQSIVKCVPQAKLRLLHGAIKKILLFSIEKGGSTDRNYVNAEGKRGSYIDFAKVFRKENMPCPVCQHEIIKLRVAGRGTHVCKYCQKLYKEKIK